MGAEVLLYGYGIVCLSMLVFNVIYSLHLRADDRRTQKRVEVIQRQAEGQLENCVLMYISRSRPAIWPG